MIETALVLEDNADARKWLESALVEVFEGIEIDGAITLAEASGLVARRKYDLALVDLSLPDGSGIDLLVQLQESSLNRETIAIVATIFDDDQHIFPALQAGAAGYLLKDNDLQQFKLALTGIVDGRPPLSSAIARKLLGYFHQQPGDNRSTRLTEREHEVLQLIAKGFRISEIGRLLSISHHTAADYVKSIYRKLNINSRAEAAVEAVRRGLV